MMKDELGGKSTKKFVTLKMKMYAYRKLDKKLKDKRCKGIGRSVVTKKCYF